MKHFRLRTGLAVSTLLFSLGTVQAFAQGILAEIHGTVLDPTGAPISNATITVTDTAKGWTRVLYSNDRGEYELPQLEPDSISVAVEALGFKRSVHNGITLQTGQQAQIDFKLDTGDVTETVSVSADASQVQAENGAQGTVIESRKIVELPLNGRNFFQLAQLVPNVVPPIPNFNSLSAQLQRRYSHGMTLLVAYTYSHSLDDAPYSGSLQDPQNLPSQYASSDFDVRHRLVASFTYELPFGHNGNHFTDSIIGGWQANGIFVYQTGIPFTVTTSKDISNTGASNYANLVPGEKPSLSDPTPARWFNTSAFNDVQPAGTFAYGTAGRNLLASDGPVNLDLGVYRRIAFIHETYFQLRAEVYNTINHPTFSSPVTNVEAGNFGSVTSTSNNPRQTQFALKYVF